MRRGDKATVEAFRKIGVWGVSTSKQRPNKNRVADVTSVED
jgi:hypothetical protein